MDFGVVMQSSWSAKDLVSSTVLAEGEGLDFVLVSDHYLTPSTRSSVDTWTALAAMAARTERIRIGTCVTPIPFRPPQMLAKVVSTVDQISDGRVILGVGAGWYRPEFDAYSVWDEGRVRAAKTVEGLDLLKRLWTAEEPFDFSGRYYRAKGAVLEPKPVQRPHPPIWFGTSGRYMLKMARKYASGWVPPLPGISMDAYREVAAALEGSDVKIKFNGTCDQIAENIEAFAELGCDGGMLSKTAPSELQTAIKRLVKQVVPSYR